MAVVYWGTRDTDTATSTWDGFVAETRNGLDADPTWRSVQLDQARPTMPNGIGEPIEEAGVDIAPTARSGLRSSRTPAPRPRSSPPVLPG